MKRLMSLLLALALALSVSMPASVSGAEAAFPFSIDPASMAFASADVKPGESAILEFDLSGPVDTVTDVQVILTRKGNSSLNIPMPMERFTPATGHYIGQIDITSATRYDYYIVDCVEITTESGDVYKIFNSQYTPAPPDGMSDVADFSACKFLVASANALVYPQTIQLETRTLVSGNTMWIFMEGNDYVDSVTINYIRYSDTAENMYQSVSMTRANDFVWSDSMGFLDSSYLYGQISFNDPGVYKISYIQLFDLSNYSSEYRIYNSENFNSYLDPGDLMMDLEIGDFVVQPPKTSLEGVHLYPDSTLGRKILLVAPKLGYSGVSGYRIYYRRSDVSAWSYKDTYVAATTLTMGTSGAKYYFKIRPFVQVQNIKYLCPTDSPTLSIYTLKAVEQNTPVKYGTRSVKVSWKDIPGQTGYQIYRSTSYSGTYTRVKTITSTSATYWIDTTTSVGRTYYYKVRAIRSESFDTARTYFDPYTVYSGYSPIKKIVR